MRKISLSSVVGEPVSHDPSITKHVFLRKGQVPCLTNFSRAVLAPGQSVSPHSHADMFEVFYIASGRGVLRVDDTELPVTTGDCLLVEPGESHRLCAGERDSLELLYFGILADAASRGE